MSFGRIGRILGVLLIAWIVGDNGSEEAHAVQQTSDGGYAGATCLAALDGATPCPF